MKYIDKSYIDKRKELRRFYFEQPMAYQLVSYIIHNIDLEGYAQLNDMINLKDVVKDILIDGYVAYVRTKLNLTNTYTFLKIDPTYIFFGQTIKEIRYPDGTIEKIKSEDLVYISYWDISYTEHNSLVEQMMITGLSLDIHKKYIDILIDNIPKIFEKFDSNYYRRKKLQRITR